MSDPTNQNDALQALEVLTSYIDSGAAPEDFRDRMSQLVTLYQDKFDMTLIAIAQARIARLSILMTTQNELEDMLFSEQNMARASLDPETLIAMHKIARQSILDTQKLLQETGTLSPDPNSVNQFFVNAQRAGSSTMETLQDLPTKSRQNIDAASAKVASLLKTLDRLPS